MEIFKKSLLFGIGLMTITREKAEKVMQNLVERGEVGTEDAKNFVNELLEKGDQEKAAVQETIKKEFEDIRKKFDFVTKTDIAQLEAKIGELEAKLTALQASSEEPK